MIIEMIQELVLYGIRGRGKLNAKIAELEATRQKLIQDQQLLLADIFRNGMPSAGPRPLYRRPELRN